tara:strand:+ start:106 stop:771 length:666 start_codon:yes stop_codon:yes gene_type:complete
MKKLVKKKITISNKDNEIIHYIINQLNNFFPAKKKISKLEIKYQFKIALEKSFNCYDKIKTKFFENNKDFIFNSDKYTILLYFLSNEVYKSNKNKTIADRLYYLNKALHGIDLHYEVEMPDIFYLIHPVGTVLGRASYKNYFVSYQNCTVGSNKNIFPKIDEYVTMRPGTTIIGNSNISKNCEISINSLIVDKNVDKNSIYFGNPKNFIIKKNQKKNRWFD